MQNDDPNRPMAAAAAVEVMQRRTRHDKVTRTAASS
jgi:hypothetical protein